MSRPNTSAPAKAAPLMTARVLAFLLTMQLVSAIVIHALMRA